MYSVRVMVRDNSVCVLDLQDMGHKELLIKYPVHDFS